MRLETRVSHKATTGHLKQQRAGCDCQQPDTTKPRVRATCKDFFSATSQTSTNVMYYCAVLCFSASTWSSLRQHSFFNFLL